jgi:hypothetical protein
MGQEEQIFWLKKIKTSCQIVANTAVSGAGGSHPNALQDPYVTVSRHTAPTVQSMAESQIPKTRTVSVHGVQCDPTNGLP